jgi:hypothetical protein
MPKAKAGASNIVKPVNSLTPFPGDNHNHVYH